MKKLLLLFLSLFCAVTVIYAATQSFNKLPRTKIAEVLGWFSAPNNICGGYYKQPDIVNNHPHPAALKKTAVHVTADKKALYSVHGTSVLQGHVIVTQPGREVSADKVIFHRDKKSGKIISADLYGNVALREYGKVVVGTSGYINFITKEVVLDDVLYRIATNSPTGFVNLWGRAKKAVRDKSQVLTLYDATYSTCQPNSECWHLFTSRLRLNKYTGIGDLANGVMFFKDMPVFYFPYLRFPIDKRRRSGFLYPTVSFSTTSGFNFSLPFYLNLAPNYDALITPHIYLKRGLLTNGQFRYLNADGSGQLRLGYIPGDKEFSSFRAEALKKYRNISGLKKALRRLKNSSSNRGALAWQNNTKFNQHWNSIVNLNYVTDDYYLQDFSGVASEINDNQLLNRLDLNYANEHWRFLGRVQGFQTLYQVTDKAQAQAQYYRLPQFALDANYPSQALGLDYDLNSGFVNFAHEDENPAVVIGQRYNIVPGISRPFESGAGFITPKLQLASTFYSLQNLQRGRRSDSSRVLPIVSLDSGLRLQRSLNIFGSGYWQTLEPRLYYLYVPYRNQNSVPIFDTSLTAFDYNSLIRTNRFSGIDRFGDANQVAMTITSRFLRQADGAEKLRFSVGDIYAFQKHRVTLPNSTAVDPLLNRYFSPIAAQLAYSIRPHWTLNGGLAFDVYNKRANSGALALQYNPALNRLFNVGYIFERVRPKRLDIANLSFTWPFFKRWHLFLDWNYDLTDHAPFASLYGLEYDSCCWAFRVVASRTLTGYDVTKRKNIFEQRYFLQLMLKGLGSVGNKGASSLLTQRITGFNDSFATGLI